MKSRPAWRSNRHLHSSSRSWSLGSLLDLYPHSLSGQAELRGQLDVIADKINGLTESKAPFPSKGCS